MSLSPHFQNPRGPRASPHFDGSVPNRKEAGRKRPHAGTTTGIPSSPLQRRRRARAIIIGQAPPPSSSEREDDDFVALQGPPERRLARLVGCASPQELWKLFERRNVLGTWPGSKRRAPKHRKAAGYTKHESAGDLFPLNDARLEALRIDLTDYALVIMLGLNVARSFHVKPELLHREVLRPTPGSRNGTLVLVFPHPSGVSHFWNNPERVSRAEMSLRAAMAVAGVGQAERGLTTYPFVRD